MMTLRYGVREGAYMVVGSALLAGLICVLMFGTLTPVVVFAVATWIPVWLLASVLRGSASQGLMLAACGVLGVVGVLLLHLFLEDAARWWRQLLDDVFVVSARDAGLLDSADDLAQVQAVLDVLAVHMTGIVAAGAILGLVVTVLLARWWHASLDNPGGFGEEFRALMMPPRFAVAAGVVLAAALFANESTGRIAGDLAWALLMLYLIQGLAVMHSVVHARRASKGWLVGLYVLLGVLPLQATTLLAATGYADTWLGMRARVARRPPPDDPGA